MPVLVLVLVLALALVLVLVLMLLVRVVLVLVLVLLVLRVVVAMPWRGGRPWLTSCFAARSSSCRGRSLRTFATPLLCTWCRKGRIGGGLVSVVVVVVVVWCARDCW